MELAARLIEAVGEDTEELPQHLDRDLVLLPKDLEEVGASDGDERRRSDRGNGGGARYASDERHFADVLSRSEIRERRLAARHAHLPVEHDEELVALVAFLNDGVAVGVLAHFDRLHHAKELALRESREERHLGEHFAFERETLGAREILRRLVAELHDDGRDVVLAAAIVGELNERFDGEVAVEREMIAKLLGRLDISREPVAREDEGVACEELHHQRVDLDSLVHADRARDRVLLRELLDLLARELAALHELVEDRVILGHLLYAPGALEIDAAVADVRDEPLLPEDEQRRERRAHAALGLVLRGFFVDLRACALHGVLAQGDDVLGRDLVRARCAVDVVVEELFLALDLVVHGAHGDRARDLARGVPAHAVGDDEERELLVDEKVVLVVLAHLPDVGRRIEAHSFAELHRGG